MNLALYRVEVYRAAETPFNSLNPTTMFVEVFNVTGDNPTPKFQYRINRNSGFPDSQDKTILFGYADSLAEARRIAHSTFEARDKTELLNALEVHPLYDDPDQLRL